MKLRWQRRLDGAIVASPLYAEQLKVGGRKVDVVYAATEAGSIYALDAEGGGVLWGRQLGTVAACGDVYGISSTGVIDRTSGRLYVVGARGLLYALALGSGKTARGWPVRVVVRTGVEHVWGGLTLFGGNVYVPVASYCNERDDDGPADGRLVSVSTARPRIVARFDVVPGPANMGGIWGYGGTSVDTATGHVFTATGNAWVESVACNCVDETAGYAEQLVELTPELDVVAASLPAGIPAPIGDTDFGSTPLLFQPDGCPPARRGEREKRRRLRLEPRPDRVGADLVGAHRPRRRRRLVRRRAHLLAADAASLRVAGRLRAGRADVHRDRRLRRRSRLPDLGRARLDREDRRRSPTAPRS